MFWNFIIAIASYALQLVLTPKPQNAKAKSLEDFEAPTAEEGREIPVVFGTEDIADPNVTWYGDLLKRAIKGARRYGLFGPRQVLGYMYSLGMQMGLCHGPADSITSIRVADKEAWQGITSGGRIRIDKKSLFGGDKSEGGIVGDVDVCMGAPDQLQNDYLVSKLGAHISAFRGIVTVVLRQVYLGTSNYIKPWEFRVQRIFLRSDGSDQWYKGKAAIQSEILDFKNGKEGLDLGNLLGGSWDTSGNYAVWANLNSLKIWTLPGGSLRTIPISNGAPVSSGDVAIVGDNQVVTRQGSDDGHHTYFQFYSLASGVVAETVEATSSADGSLNTNTGFRMVDIAVDGDHYALARLDILADAMWLLLKDDGGWGVEWREPSSVDVNTITMGRAFAYCVPTGSTPTQILMVGWAGAFAETLVTPPGLTGQIVNCTYLADTDEVLIICNTSDLLVYTPDLATLKRSSTGNPGRYGSGALWAKRSSLGPGRIGLYSTVAGKRVYAVRIGDLAFDYTIEVEDTNFINKGSLLGSSPGFNPAQGGMLLPPAGTKAVFWFVASTIALDMNPAHIIRECLTDGVWGMGYHESDIDDDSFTACADTFYAEKFGLSLKWSQEGEIQEFVSTVLSHVDAYLYVSRETGKFVLKAIRDDYNIDDLLVLTDDDIVEYTEVSHRSAAEAVSAVLVKYYNRSKRKTGAHHVTNTAQAMQTTNGVTSVTREYPGITNAELAGRVAQRDVIAVGSGLISGRVVATRKAEKLNPGDPFRLQSSRHRLTGEVMRVVDLGFGDGRSNKVGVRFFQDVFRLGSATLVDSSESPWTPPSGDPLAIPLRLAWEMPYREARQMVGDADLAAMLASNADAGLLQVAAASPSGTAENASIQIDTGSGFAGTETLDFAPGAFLAADLAIDATEITVTGAVELDTATLGTLATIAGPDTLEVVRIDDIDGATLTIARGCLDTVPQAHAAGASLVLFDDINNSDFEVYSAGTEVAVKLLTNTGSGVLDLADAPTDLVTFESRAARSLRPADCQLNGQGYGTVDASALALIPATWARRNRLTELAPLAWSDADVAAEAGQTTVLRLTDPAGAEVFSYTGLSGTSHDIDPGDFGLLTSGYVVFDSVRDGYTAWQPYRIRVFLGGNLLLSGDEQSGTDQLALSGDAGPGLLRFSGLL
ncbi:hypothetical protein EOA37_09730 [Mesorhizobium sp. M2A.F.Ca.ET.015.02.1.1]|uniref:phage tail protein n=1 Tax=Mesorhizobium sp. M2A.F.Ca.ET.015.02.1.1 TaxID=2496758 RepID=UPI000FC9EC6F|nr:phage tail protein [Mesorhizobium sp. M2A.F.Ca.ET.015.02.1.1]RUW41531.1 hypothetical protein EOA37_09730 [Mesorhizobium sp. M2A.F.Ca.ET.015.02.1.1]